MPAGLTGSTAPGAEPWRDKGGVMERQSIQQEAFTDKSGRTGQAYYRFYSIDADNRIALAVDYESDGDKAALSLGRRILLASSHPKVEVWLGNLRVGVSRRIP
jgi:hypothetical protein